jgi:hypothetical protein
LKVLSLNLSRNAGEACPRALDPGVETRSGEGEGLTCRTLSLLPPDPITLALGTSHLDPEVRRPGACLRLSRGSGF